MTESSTDTGLLAEGVIDEAALEVFRSRIGTKLRVGNVFNQHVTPEAILKFTNGIGDTNPLHRDSGYAKKTRYGALVAPQNWVYSVFPTWVLQGLPGVHAFHSGNDWEFHKPILEGDVITPECIFTGFEEKQSEFAGRFIMEYQEALFHNQRGELVSKAKTWLVRAERSAARSKGKYHKLEVPHPWTEEEVAKVEADVLGERPRGAEPRFWEDVHEGQQLEPVTKGPLGLTDIIAYCVGSAPVQIMAHGVALREYERHPAWAFRDPDTGAKEPVYGVHYNRQAASSAGLPFPYDAGAQRHAWHLHLFLSWMGDEGWLKKDYGEYRKFVYLGDAVRFQGKVVRKYMDQDGEPCVDIETSAINQRGEDVMPGRGTVVLPSRELEYWPLESRLPRG